MRCSPSGTSDISSKQFEERGRGWSQPSLSPSLLNTSDATAFSYLLKRKLEAMASSSCQTFIWFHCNWCKFHQGHERFWEGVAWTPGHERSWGVTANILGRYPDSKDRREGGLGHERSEREGYGECPGEEGTANVGFRLQLHFQRNARL